MDMAGHHRGRQCGRLFPACVDDPQIRRLAGGDFPKAILVGFGSFLSFIVGTGLKVVAAVGMLIHVTADTYPAIRDWFATLF